MEKRIYDAAVIKVSQLKKDVTFQRFLRSAKGSTVTIPVLIDGVMDEIVYDLKEKKYTKVRYQVGTTDYTRLTDYTALFDETEERILEINLS